VKRRWWKKPPDADLPEHSREVILSAGHRFRLLGRFNPCSLGPRERKLVDDLLALIERWEAGRDPRTLASP